MDIENVGSVLRVYAFFTRKMSVYQLNIRGVCRCHASINLFWLRKNFNCFVRYKTIPTLLCKDRRWCPDEGPMFWCPTLYWSLSLSSMDVETTSPIHHLICGGGIVRCCTVLCVIDTYGHRWDTDKRNCFLCSEQHVHAIGDDAHLQFHPALLAWRECQWYKCLASPCDPLLIFPVGQEE